MKNKIITQKNLAEGEEILKMPAGTIWQAVNYENDEYDVVIITDEKKLISLQSGATWGPSLDDYSFEYLKKIIIENGGC